MEAFEDFMHFTIFAWAVLHVYSFCLSVSPV